MYISGLFLAARTLSSVEHSAPQARYIREVEYSVSSQQGDTSGGSGANSPPKSNSNSLNWSPQWVEGPKGDLYIGPSGLHIIKLCLYICQEIVTLHSQS